MLLGFASYAAGDSAGRERTREGRVRRMVLRGLGLIAVVLSLVVCGADSESPDSGTSPAPELSSSDLTACVKPGQDALIPVLMARIDAYDHYADGKTAQAAADLQAESVYLTRYLAWRVAQTEKTPKPTPQGGTSSSTASSWS